MRPFEKDDVAVVSGQSRTVAIALTRVEEATRTSPAKKSQITDLFVEKNWTANEGGFSYHEGSAFLKDIHFNHVFEFMRIKKSLGRREKIEWRIFTSGDDYIRYDVDGDNLTRTEVIDGKAKPAVKKPHKLTGDVFRVVLTVEAGKITVKMDRPLTLWPPTSADGPGFDGKYALRVAE